MGIAGLQLVIVGLAVTIAVVHYRHGAELATPAARMDRQLKEVRRPQAPPRGVAAGGYGTMSDNNSDSGSATSENEV